jgi:hypothetical protein
MVLSIEYMKEFIYQVLKGLDNYQAIFTMFTICLKETGMPYQTFRTKAIRNKLRQMDFRF